jgi:hypothetical protein
VLFYPVALPYFLSCCTLSSTEPTALESALIGLLMSETWRVSLDPGYTGTCNASDHYKLASPDVCTVDVLVLIEYGAAVANTNALKVSYIFLSLRLADLGVILIPSNAAGFTTYNNSYTDPMR